MSYGTAVVSSGGGGGSSASAASPGRTYVDNTSNRSIGRVGLPVGSAVVSRYYYIAMHISSIISHYYRARPTLLIKERRQHSYDTYDYDSTVFHISTYK